MELPPQKFREIVFQLLYSLDGSGSAEAELIPFLMAELSVSKKNVKLAYEKASTIWKMQAELDAIIKEKSQNYSLERIKTVEKNVLRLALYELLIEKTLSAKIIISEAHRLARKFSTVEGASFVNAVLDGEKDEKDNACESSVSTPERDLAE